ncbi:MAG: NUDIX hydrolase [Capsulimonadales bacterium]|nr:NUDIX hydrolase [Capsulimonadales bacterium]
MPSDMTETVLASERIYEGRIIRVRRDTVRLPNGQESRREVVEHSGAVAVLAMSDPQTVLLVRQFRLPTGGQLLEVVAGGVEAGEAIEECARRELQEEIGKQAGTLIPLYSAYVAPGYCTEMIYGFLALELSDSRLTHDEDEFVETVEMSLDAALTAIESGDIRDAKTIACLTMAERWLRNHVL